MKSSIARFRPLWIGAFITLGIIIFLKYLGVLLLDLEMLWHQGKPGDLLLEAILTFSFWSLTISLFIYQFNKVKNKRSFLIKVLTPFILMASTIAIDEKMDITDNPITLTLLTAFWLYLFYLLAQTFFKKYQFFILGIYILNLLIFFKLRLIDNSISEHRDLLAPMFLFPIFIFAVLWIYEQWKWLKNLKNEKVNSELALLKSQVNPHFFFNTLNNLYGLAVEKSDETPKMILKLSDIMRYSIYEGKKDVVAIEDELNYLENYIELQAIRSFNKVDINFKKELEYNNQIAPLIFINLVENAFKHGTGSMRSDAYVNISLSSSKDKIEFTIENNYERPIEEYHKEVYGNSKLKNGIGLENLQKRLNLLYPKNHILDIEDKNQIFKVSLIIEVE